MPRIFSATYTPYTYEELAAPLREATVAHQKVEEDYNNNMLVVDSLRQRAMNEPDAKWSQQILQYADQLEGYAMDLARNGLTRETRGNLLNMKRGFGTTVSPVITAMAREKDLQTIRDKANPSTRTLYGSMPTIDELIANPNASQTSYSGKDIYDTSKAQSAAYAARNIDIIPPRNISAWMYEYGKKQGFTQDEINDALQDPFLNGVFNSIKQQYGYLDDNTLTSQQKNKLDNEILLGALEGLIGTVDMKYGNRSDNPTALEDLEGKRITNQINRIKLNGLTDTDTTGLGMYHDDYYRQSDEYQNLWDQKNKLEQIIYDNDGNLKPEYKTKQIVDNKGNIINYKIEDIYDSLKHWVKSYQNKDNPDARSRTIQMPGKPKGFQNVEDEKLIGLWNQIQGYESIRDAMKDFKIEGGIDNHVFQTRDNLEDYLDSLATNKYSTKIDFYDNDLIADALRGYANGRDEYQTELVKVDEYLRDGESYGRRKKNDPLKVRVSNDKDRLKGSDIEDMDYLISDPYNIIINVRGEGRIKVPVSWMFSEMNGIIDNYYNNGIIQQNGQKLPSYRSMVETINNYTYSDNPSENNRIKREKLQRAQIMYQDLIAHEMKEFFRRRQDQKYSETTKMED